MKPNSVGFSLTLFSGLLGVVNSEHFSGLSLAAVIGWTHLKIYEQKKIFLT